MQIHADPDPGCTLKTKNVNVKKIMKNFNENKVTTNIFIPITLIFRLFMSDYLSVTTFFSSSFLLFLDLLDPDPHSECGSMWIRILNTGSDTLQNNLNATEHKGNLWFKTIWMLRNIIFGFSLRDNISGSGRCIFEGIWLQYKETK
jgi:hypothetical protein